MQFISNLDRYQIKYNAYVFFESSSMLKIFLKFENLWLKIWSFFFKFFGVFTGLCFEFDRSKHSSVINWSNASDGHISSLLVLWRGRGKVVLRRNWRRGRVRPRPFVATKGTTNFAATRSGSAKGNIWGEGPWHPLLIARNIPFPVFSAGFRGVLPIPWKTPRPLLTPL